MSEIENGLSNDINATIHEVEDLNNELLDYADMRRKQMLLLYKMYGEKGDKKQWCIVKHLSMAMYTMFECWQASEDDEMQRMYLDINAMFIKAVTKFIGTEITSCASCFADILKGELNETSSMQDKL